jgi:NADPH-dependent curcumin reductase CurA
MSKLTSREICLASRPSGIPTAANFKLVWTAAEPLKDQEVLVRNLFMSVDPYLRGYFKAGKLKNLETTAKGIDRAVEAFLGLFQGRNLGKMVVELACS